MGYIITADDFGLSQGINEAVIDAHLKGGLTHASLMVTTDYVDQAVALAKEHPSLKVGLHLDFTCGKSLVKNASFNHGFVGLLLKSVVGRKKRAFTSYLYREVDAQIRKAQNLGLTLAHIDGHRHIHTIPAVFAIVSRLAKKYGVGRIRLVNECFFKTWRITRSLSFLGDGNWLKYILLKGLYRVNRTRSDTYFFSILHSCKISPKKVQKLTIPKGYAHIEVMLHPGRPKIDQKDNSLIYEKKQLLSPYREIEYQSALMLKQLFKKD